MMEPFLGTLDVPLIGSIVYIYSIFNVLCRLCTLYNQGQKLYGQLRKMALSLTTQAMHNQFKKPSAGTVRELYYIYNLVPTAISSRFLQERHMAVGTRLLYL